MHIRSNIKTRNNKTNKNNWQLSTRPELPSHCFSNMHGKYGYTTSNYQFRYVLQTLEPSYFSARLHLSLLSPYVWIKTDVYYRLNNRINNKFLNIPHESIFTESEKLLQ
ncbi:uncharacterized protein LOC119677667 [Teleopsis dalmanni]|uniref:uncharacterized protein LOC119677667 n=1 Tax=Teleopsis dalmanni TaxID=139649 RepID=UPI0018CD838F|nr:uncharacterized protein LOC119677667 [Teleopsis dalmanni]